MKWNVEVPFTDTDVLKQDEHDPDLQIAVWHNTTKERALDFDRPIDMMAHSAGEQSISSDARYIAKSRQLKRKISVISNGRMTKSTGTEQEDDEYSDPATSQDHDSTKGGFGADYARSQPKRPRRAVTIRAMQYAPNDSELDVAQSDVLSELDRKIQKLVEDVYWNAIDTDDLFIRQPARKAHPAIVLGECNLDVLQIVHATYRSDVSDKLGQDILECMTSNDIAPLMKLWYEDVSDDQNMQLAFTQSTSITGWGWQMDRVARHAFYHGSEDVPVSTDFDYNKAMLGRAARTVALMHGRCDPIRAIQWVHLDKSAYFSYLVCTIMLFTAYQDLRDHKDGFFAKLFDSKLSNPMFERLRSGYNEKMEARPKHMPDGQVLVDLTSAVKKMADTLANQARAYGEGADDVAPFTSEEDLAVLKAYKYVENRFSKRAKGSDVQLNWKEIADVVPGRTADECQEAYQQLMSEDLDAGSGDEEQAEVLTGAKRQTSTDRQESAKRLRLTAGTTAELVAPRLAEKEPAPPEYDHALRDPVRAPQTLVNEQANETSSKVARKGLPPPDYDQSLHDPVLEPLKLITDHVHEIAALKAQLADAQRRAQQGDELRAHADDVHRRAAELEASNTKLETSNADLRRRMGEANVNAIPFWHPPVRQTSAGVQISTDREQSDDEEKCERLKRLTELETALQHEHKTKRILNDRLAEATKTICRLNNERDNDAVDAADRAKRLRAAEDELHRNSPAYVDDLESRLAAADATISELSDEITKANAMAEAGSDAVAKSAKQFASKSRAHDIVVLKQASEMEKLKATNAVLIAEADSAALVARKLVIASQDLTKSSPLLQGPHVAQKKIIDGLLETIGEQYYRIERQAGTMNEQRELISKLQQGIWDYNPLPKPLPYFVDEHYQEEGYDGVRWRSDDITREEWEARYGQTYGCAKDAPRLED
ncbi:hypothetical protein LTR56_009624 [Elasticomyces elasticus]|nr:hypothetical protein LTR56_009624 [Elasticomyces elasticus]KAK3660124.1 hypothetical protein LTR22_008131 [Elasticomyces elasticus]KAK4923429.1 hypothetical protein LTR49_009303 [Elasticomyces elasticus]KAK5752301.1 hypothetical protein LTS12_017602 [Elasticomyces elasticus]